MSKKKEVRWDKFKECTHCPSCYKQYLTTIVCFILENDNDKNSV